MKKMEEKLNAILRCLAAERMEDREAARAQLRVLMSPSQTQTWNAEDQIRELLLQLGMPDHLKGHRYLVYALATILEDPSLRFHLTKDLYPKIAHHFYANTAQVERAIRHAIEVCWDRGDLDVLSLYFGNTISAHKGKPTNGEFLARIHNILQKQLRQAA